MARETIRKVVSLRIAIYSRKSKFTGKGESIENQVEMCRAYITAHFPEVKQDDIIIFEDEGFSGKTLQRPNFQKMMQAIRHGDFQCLLCYRLDRISRSVGDFSQLIQELNERQVSFICLREDFNTTTPAGRAMMLMVSVFAQLERETIAERVRDNMLLLARTGRWLGGTPPTGFISAQKQEVILEGKSKSSYYLAWHEEEMTTVRSIYETFFTCQSLTGTAKRLQKLGIYSRHGKPFSVLGIKDILRNPVYCIADTTARDYFLAKGADVCFSASECSATLGLLAYNKRDYSRKSGTRLAEDQWILAIGKHHGLLTGCDWVTIQKKLAENKTSHIGHGKLHNNYALLSGLLYCSRCGQKLFAKPRSNRAPAFDYICSRKLRGGTEACTCPNLNGLETDRQVLAFLAPYWRETADLLPLLTALKRRYQETPLANPVQKQQQLLTELNHCCNILLQEDLSPLLWKQFKQKADLLEVEIEQLKEEAEKTIPHFLQEKELQQLAWQLEDFSAIFPLLPFAEQRELLRNLVKQISWDGKALRVELAQ